MSQHASPSSRTQAALAPGRLRSHSLDSGAPLMPPPLISTGLFPGEEDEDEDEIFYSEMLDPDSSTKSSTKRKLSGKNQRENYHCRKYDGNSEVRVRAQVMLRDDSTGGWVPMGGGGLANVSVRKRKIQHKEYDQPCRHEYLIHGKRIPDNSIDPGEVVLNCAIKKDFEYNKVMPTFHHWKTGNRKFGLTFQTAADAKAFDRGVRAAVQDLLDANSLACPHKHYKDHKRKVITEAYMLHRQQHNQDCDDDDVFMQLVLPVDKGCESRSPVYSRGSRSPSPTDALSSLAPSSSKSPLSSSKIGAPLPLLPSGSGIYVCKGPDPTLHHLQFHPRTRAILEQITCNEKKAQQQQQHADKIENLGSGARTLDKEYSYVKFPRRELPHEYSYPKLIDTYREGDEKISSAKSSFKRSTHLPVEKCNSGGSDPGKVSLVLIGSGSSLGSSSNFDSSHSGGSTGDGKRQHQSTSSKKLFLPSEDTKSGLPCPVGSPAKTSLTGLSPIMTFTCAHCRETFCLEDNRVGVCSYAPADRARTLIETATCLQCAKCLLYHCMSDTEGNYVHPCECSNSDGHWARRWIGLSLLSILVPCLCCYVPLMACYKCGATCNLCGGRHEAQ